LRDLLLSAVLVILIPLSLFRPFIGALGWTWVSYFNPHLLTWGFTRQLPVAMLIAIPTMVGMLFARNRRLPPFTRETVLLLALWLWFGVTTVHTYFTPLFSHHFPETLEQYWYVTKIILMTVVCMMLVTNRQRLRWWYLVTLGSLGYYALKGTAFGIVTGGQYRVYGPGSSMIADNNELALALNICLPMFYFLAQEEQSRIMSLAFRAGFVCSIVAIVLTYSRGGLLGLAVVLFMLALQSRYKVRAAVAMALIGLLILAYAPETWMERMRTITMAPATDPSALGRIRAWQLASDLATDYPLTGGGFRTFTLQLYERYNLGGKFILGPHSIYFQVLGEHGFVGLLLFLVLCGCAFLSCGKIVRRYSGKDTPTWPIAYAKALRASFAAFFISGAFLGRAYFDLFFQLVATVILVKALARRELAEAQAEAPAAELQHAEEAATPLVSR